MTKRTMPICFTPEQYEKIKQYARQHKMTNVEQAIEKLLQED